MDLIDKYWFSLVQWGQGWLWVLLGARAVCVVVGMLLFLQVRPTAGARRSIVAALNLFVFSQLLLVYELLQGPVGDSARDQMMWYALRSLIELIYIQVFLSGVTRLGDYVGDSNICWCAALADKFFLVYYGLIIVMMLLGCWDKFLSQIEWLFTEEWKPLVKCGLAALSLVLLVAYAFLSRAMWRLQSIEAK